MAIKIVRKHVFDSSIKPMLSSVHVVWIRYQRLFERDRGVQKENVKVNGRKRETIKVGQRRGTYQNESETHVKTFMIKATDYKS